MWPIMVVQHMGADSGDYLGNHLNKLSKYAVTVADDKVKIEPGHAYIAPGGYHMLLDDDLRISLSLDERVCYSRPSVDVLFESVAEVCREGVIAVVLTGANSDGASGVCEVKRCGGTVLVQDPDEAESEAMPDASIKTGCADVVLPISGIADYLNEYCHLHSEEVGRE